MPKNPEIVPVDDYYAQSVVSAPADTTEVAKGAKLKIKAKKTRSPDEGVSESPPSTETTVVASIAPSTISIPTAAPVVATPTSPEAKTPESTKSASRPQTEQARAKTPYVPKPLSTPTSFTPIPLGWSGDSQVRLQSKNKGPGIIFTAPTPSPSPTTEGSLSAEAGSRIDRFDRREAAIGGGERPRLERPRSGQRPQIQVHVDRSGSDRPTGERSHFDRPRSDRPQGDRPRSDRPQGERPTRPDRPPRTDRPQGGDRPRWASDRPHHGGPRPGGRMAPSHAGSTNFAVDVTESVEVIREGGPNNRYHSGGRPKKDRNKLTSHTNPKGFAKKQFDVTSTEGEEEIKGFRRSKSAKIQKKDERTGRELRQILVDKTGQDITLPESLSVKEFSEKIGIPLGRIIAELMRNGMIVHLNTRIDYDTCFLVAESFGITISREESHEVSALSLLEWDISELIKEDDPSRLVERAPIISIMGHVDHGKTSILDYIRNTSVATSEAGGITQKIGAYQVEKNGRKITFLDTPGHEAFSTMRARGSKLTDIIVIVVAADEGVKPQTIESINLALQVKVPVIVAINKIDKPGSNPDEVKRQVAEKGLIPEEWGGNTIFVPVSAHTGQGINDLLDMILLASDVCDLKANPDRQGVATVIEARLDAKLGHTATILVNTGVLKKGDCAVCAGTFGRIRVLRDYRGRNIDDAGPSTPVLIAGLNGPVEGGDILQVVSDIRTAETKAHELALIRSTRSINTFESASLDMMLNRIKSGSLKHLKIVLKCDSNGSLEVLRGALYKLSTDDIQVDIIHVGIGDINDTDVLMAGMSQGLLIGYNVATTANAKTTLMGSRIECINKSVIYHILEKVEAIVTGMIDLKHDDIDVGILTVKAIFYSGKEKLIVGCHVTTGNAENKAKVRIIRDGKKVGSGDIQNLKSGPSDVHEIEAGGDCGISLRSDIVPEIGDTIEMYKLVPRKQA